MNTTGQTAARAQRDQETLHRARLDVIGKIADKHPRFQPIIDHEHPLLIGKTHAGVGVFLIWSDWGMAADLTADHTRAAWAATAAHALSRATMHIYSYGRRSSTTHIRWHPTVAEGLESETDHARIDAITRHFTDNPDKWTVRKAAERSWFVIDAHGHIVEHATTKRQALAEARDGLQRQTWHKTRAWYLEQPGARADGSRPLTPHERAYIRHNHTTPEQTL